MDFHVTTKYLGPTNTKGARIMAKCYGIGKVVVDYDYSVNLWERHVNAALALIAKGGIVGSEKDIVSAALLEAGYSLVFSFQNDVKFSSSLPTGLDLSLPIHS